MKSDLSARELSVLLYAVKGFTDDMISNELNIEVGTVNSYWVRIRGKLGNFSRTELVARFVQTNADLVYAERKKQDQIDAASLADENRTVLAAAQAQIDVLTSNAGLAQAAYKKQDEIDAAILATQNREELDTANAMIDLLTTKAELTQPVLTEQAGIGVATLATENHET